MNDRLVWDGVVAVIRDTFDDASLEVTRETTADDIPEWDSLRNVELVVALESAFRVRLHTGEIARLKSVGELADVIAARVRDDAR